MKQFFLKPLLLLIGLLFVPNLVSAQAVEQITSYQVEINVAQDGLLGVVEKIDYDFGASDRHGIFRNIPTEYKTALGKFNLKLNDISVTNNFGQQIPFTTTQSDGEIKLKIGDPDKTVSGVQSYTISYQVRRAINFFPEHDELYWNAIGSGWTVPILTSSIKVNLPAAATKTECFLGPNGSTNTGCTKLAQDTTAPQFIYQLPLLAGEGFTIVVAMPSGTITKPTTLQKITDVIVDNGVVAVPIIVFLVMLYLWNRFGKDAKGRGTIVAQFEPPQGLSPLYLGTLVDGKLDNKDFSAEIIFMAVHGYLKIDRIETKTILWFKGQDYQLTKLKPADQFLSAQGNKLFEALFGSLDVVHLSDFKSNPSFGLKMRAIPSAVYKELKQAGYYKYDPNLVRILTIVAGIFIGFGLAFISANFYGALGVISGIISGLIIIIFGVIMPARTKLGAETREYILGLKLYLGVAEKDRLAFANAPEKKPQVFEALLPFAVALGVEKQWAKQFEGIYNQQPNWYNDSTGRAFNVALLSNSVGDFSSSMQSAVSSISTASSGGSGFSGGGSGGGGGGGGGGSW